MFEFCLLTINIGSGYCAIHGNDMTKYRYEEDITCLDDIVQTDRQQEIEPIRITLQPPNSSHPLESKEDFVRELCFNHACSIISQDSEFRSLSHGKDFIPTRVAFKTLNDENFLSTNCTYYNANRVQYTASAVAREAAPYLLRSGGFLNSDQQKALQSSLSRIQ